jgi:hypothetical protein
MDACNYFEIHFPISEQQVKAIKSELDFVMTYTAEGRQKVVDFFLVAADQPDSTEIVAQLYAVFMKKVEEVFKNIEDIPPEYLALLQSSNLVLLTTNIIFIKTAYNRIHIDHSHLLIDTLISMLRSSTDLLPSLLSSLCHINVSLEVSKKTSTPSFSTSTFSQNFSLEILYLLHEIFTKHPKITTAVIKSMFLFYLEAEYNPDSRGAFIFPPVLRLALDNTTIPTDSSASSVSASDSDSGVTIHMFCATMQAICVEAVSELALRLSTPQETPSSSSWEVARLLSAIGSMCGAQRLSALTIISESILFSKLSAKPRIAAVRYISRALDSSHGRAAADQPQQHSGSIIIQVKAVMTLLDVAMLDPVSSVRSEALKALLLSCTLPPVAGGGAHDGDGDGAESPPSPPQCTLQLGGKDMLRVAVFKCRDKSSEVRALAFQLLQEAVHWALPGHFSPSSSSETAAAAAAQPPPQQQQQQQLSPEELIAVTKHLLQVGTATLWNIHTQHLFLSLYYLLYLFLSPSSSTSLSSLSLSSSSSLSIVSLTPDISSAVMHSKTARVCTSTRYVLCNQ